MVNNMLSDQVVNKERIFRIGTAAACEIVVQDGMPANVVWVHLAVSSEGMHLLTIVEQGITCSVNGNVVAKQYWINEDDEIEIEGRILNWDYIRGDSNEPFNIKKTEKTFNKLLIIIPVVFIAVGLILYALLYDKPEQIVHIPTAPELYLEACDKLSSVNVDEARAGYDRIERLAIDSLYVPAVLKYYEIILDAKDTIRWDAAYDCMFKIAADDSLNLEAVYECALCMSYISPKLSLPEVRRYDFIRDKNYEEANRLLEIVIQKDSNNYRAPFWEIINLITLYNGRSLSEPEKDKLKALYVLLDNNLSVSSEELAVQYRAETERVIKTILQNWYIIK